MFSASLTATPCSILTILRLGLVLFFFIAWYRTDHLHVAFRVTGTPCSIQTILRLGLVLFFIAWFRIDHLHVAFRVTFSFHTLLSLSPIMPTSPLPPIQFPLPLRVGYSPPLLRNFRDVTLTRRGNNAVADDFRWPPSWSHDYAVLPRLLWNRVNSIVQPLNSISLIQPRCSTWETHVNAP